MEQGQLSAYERAQELAQNGNCQAALVSITQHLQANPNDGKALNDAGAILYSLGRLDEARRSVEHARQIEGDQAEILWNLSEIYLAQGSPDLAAQIVAPFQKLDLLTADFLNRIAASFIDQGEKASGLEMLLKSLELSPNQDQLTPLLEKIKTQRAKIAFFPGDNDSKFLSDIIAFTEKRFPVQVFTGKTVSQMYELMKWSDISWFEWCTEQVVEASKLPRVCWNIARLHRWEAYEDYPKRIMWESIDALVMVGNSFVAKALRQQVPNIDSLTRVLTIPNGIDLNKFQYVERKHGKNLACIGFLTARKNPMFLLQCMQKLHFIDPQYKLYFAGDFRDGTLEQYVRHMVNELGLAEVVFFDGWQNDINKWLEDKHYIVSSSIGESQGMGIIEGMARGLKPVIHNFPGAGEIFPQEFLFGISEDFCRLVLSQSYEPWRYREFVSARYPLSTQLDSIDQVLRHFENTPLRNNLEVNLCRERLLPFCDGKGLDVGCGDNKICPQAIGIDLTDPTADVKADAIQLPFENESMDYVFSSHCLEDLQDTGAALAQWMRVLKTGGNLVLYLPHRNFYPRVGKPGANPHHKHDLDPNTVLAALSQTSDYEILHLDESGTAGQHSFALVVRKLPRKTFTNHVLVEHDAVVGDIMCIEPAIRALKNKLGDQTAITLRVTHPDLFRNHPCVNRIEHTRFPYRFTGYQQHLKLDWHRTEQNASMHLVERSASQIGVSLEGIDKRPMIYLDQWDNIMLDKFHLPAAGPKIAIAAGVRWPSRSWASRKWVELVRRLEKQFNARIIQLGSAEDEFFGLGLNLIDQTTPREAAAVLSKCDLAICVDNGLAHLAAAVQTPRVVLFGPVSPELRMHSGPGTSVIAHASDCRGCFHSMLNHDVNICPKGHTNCMEHITVEDVINASQCRLQACRDNQNA